MSLTDYDRAIIERLVFDPSLRPQFEMLRSCLVWADERPVGLSSDGYAYLIDLWAVRGFIHRGIPTEQWGLGPEPFLETWDDALGSGLRWPGFRRLALSTQDRAFLTQQLSASAVEDLLG